MKHRLASFVSGNGSTMQFVIKAIQNGELGMEMACVISSSPDSKAVSKAKKLGVPIKIINPNDFINPDKKIDREKFGKAILKVLKKYKASVITLNGWLFLIPENVIDGYKNFIFNQHPGPLPEFGGRGMYGKRVHGARINFAHAVNRDFWTEALVQRVDYKYDRGAVVKLQRIRFSPEDNPESLREKVLPIEHKIQIELLKDVASGNVKEIKRRKSLVRFGEKEILEKAKEMAIRLYPRG